MSRSALTLSLDAPSNSLHNSSSSSSLTSPAPASPPPPPPPVSPPPPIVPAPRSFPHSSLPSISSYRIRDLLSSHAVRVGLNREDVAKTVASSLYAPRSTTALYPSDFTALDSAFHSYAGSVAATSNVSRVKNNKHSAANMATALLEAGQERQEQKEEKQSREARLSDIWSMNREKAAREQRLKTHVRRLVDEWSTQLAQFEENVARKQEDALYNKYLLPSSSLPGCAQKLPANYQSESAHYRSNDWKQLDDAKAGKNVKEKEKARKKWLDYEASHSVCTSPLSPPPSTSSLKHIMDTTAIPIGKQAPLPLYSSMNFSTFRPATAQMPPDLMRMQSEERPATQPVMRLPLSPQSSTVPFSALSAAAALASVNTSSSPSKPTVSGSTLQAVAGYIPSPPPPSSVHLSRRLDMLSVEQSRRRLGEANVHVTRSVLERALVPPTTNYATTQHLLVNAQPQPNEMEVKAFLPQPFYSLSTNPFLNKATKKKKGKKGKGKKKGSKKK